MNLAIVTGFDWDKDNARKNERHGVTQAEIEQVFVSAPLVLASDSKHSTVEARHHALGRTDADRWLHVMFTLVKKGTLIRPISARDMHRKEGPLYEQAIKGSS